MKFNNLILIILFLCGSFVYAQDETPAGTEKKATVVPDADSNEPVFLNRSAVGVNLGLPGLGMEFAYNLNPHFNLRARGSFVNVSDYTVEMDLSNQPVQIVGNINVLALDIVAEYLPFSRSSFKLVGGVSYLSNTGGSVQIIYNDEIQYGDITLTKEEVGDLTIGLDYSGLAPYMGLGFGRAVPKRRLGVSFEAGTYYAGSPDVSLSATNMFAPTAEAEGQQLEDNLASYSWLPYLTLKLAFRL